MNGIVTPDGARQTHDRRAIWVAGTLSYTTTGLVILFFWLLWGDFAWSMRERSLPPIIQLLFRKYGASDTATAFFMGSLPMIASMIIGPIVGYKSDRLCSRMGRRIPFLLIPTPVILLAIAGLAFSSKLGEFANHLLGANSPGLNPLILIVFGLFWTVFELACITTNSVFASLVNDVVPQPVIGRFFGLFRALSLLAGIVFNYWLLAKSETHQTALFISIAVLYGIGIVSMCLNVKEGTYPPPPDRSDHRSGIGSCLSATKAYFKKGFGNSYYLCFFAMFAAAGLMSGPVNMFSVFYAKSVNMGLDDYGKRIALTYIISLVLAYPVGYLSDRFHPIKMTMLTMLLYVIVALWGAVYAKCASTFGIALIAHGVISGAYMTASASIMQRILPSARFGELSSACGLIVSIFSIAFAPCMGMILDATGHSYRYTFYAGAIIGSVAIVLNLVVYRKFVRLGGPEHYVAPE